MNHIGRIIKKYRIMRKMSQKALAKNICTEKYVYLIEKGERTPSAEMIGLFGDRLEVDLFDYYQFMDCADPVAVSEILKKFQIYQSATDFESMPEIVREAEKLPDLKKKPWIYELEANRFGCMVFKDNQYAEAIKGMTRILANIDAKHKESIYVANLHMLLSTCYQITGDLEHAKESTQAAYEIIRPKFRIEKYRHAVITVRLNFMTLYYLLGEFSRAVEEAEELIAYQKRYNAWSRIHFTYAFLAFSYYEAGQLEEAFANFEHMIQMSLFNDQHTDIFFISLQPSFAKMAADERADRIMMKKFWEKYGETLGKK